jgi:hypothetical protein
MKGKMRQLKKESLIKLSDALKFLKPVFARLRDVHQQYIDDSPKKDFPYWYSERPQVGFLAAAVWKCGGIALEEYGTNKTEDDKRGRGDLFIKIGGKGFDCEAKRLWLRFSRSEDSEDLVGKILKDKNDGLKQAEINVKDHSSNGGLALCFVTPAIKGQTPEKDHYELLEKVIRSLKNKVDAMVWIGFQDWENGKQKNDDTYYPGLLLVIKKVGHS